MFSIFGSQTEVSRFVFDKRSLEIRDRKDLLGYQAKFIPEENSLKPMEFHRGWICHRKIVPCSIFRSALSSTVLISSALVKVLYCCFSLPPLQRTVSS